uniref:Excision repair cross-complementation group 5 n=1 Tax=Echeneis naucrates TaxID=173247 RepID=A0A665TML9_ECHNA
MGVHGLWRLLESTGKPINPETLEGKILAVDISIWLNQAVKGVRDRDGNSVQNAHLLTLFHRICKLLFFRIRPVFVFDGDAPLLKRQTLALRRQRKEELSRESNQTNEKLLKTFLKRQAIKAALGDRSFCPTLQEEFYEDPNSVDINSEEFASLPPEMKHEILKDMKEFSKRRRTMYHKPPQLSGDFSQYQLAGLLQRNQLNQRLEKVEKEMSQQSAGSAPQLYQKDGDQENHSVESHRLVSEDHSHYILIKGFTKTKTASENLSAPLWRPVCEGEEDVLDPPSEECKPSASKPSEGDNSPPSPRTLRAIQAAMNDSSDEEKVDRDKNGGRVSPQTLLAIQQALAEEEDGAAEHSTPTNSSVPELQVNTHHPAPQVVISSSEEEAEPDDAKWLPLQESNFNGNSTSKNLRAKDILFNISYEDEMEEVIGQRNKALHLAVLQQPQERKKLSEENPKKGEVTEDMRTGRGVQTEKEEELVRRESVHRLVIKEGDLVQPQGAAAAAACGQNKLTMKAFAHECGKSAEAEFQRSNKSIEGLEERSGDDVKSDGSDESESEGTISLIYHIKKSMLIKIVNLVLCISSEGFIEVSEEESKEQDADGSPRIAREKRSPVEIHRDRTQNQEKPEDGLPEVSAVALKLDKEDHDIERHGTENQEEDLKEETETESVSAPTVNEWEHLDVDELEALESSLQVEQSNLREQKQQQERMANTVTGQMYLESQELLRLFGVPFLVAPMEAEAQCAALDRADQTNGTITDDSDVWLFGGRHVYKNFFSQNKYVEHYQYNDLQNQLGLDRTKLINLAYLLGSDYTEGVPGVGYVTGMEILNEFPGPGLEPLTQFSKWWSEAQEKKRLTANPRHTKVKKKLRDLKLQPGFPNPAVAHAYLQPAVDQSDGSFSWGLPQLDMIKEYPFCPCACVCRKTEETLQPVIKQLNSQQTQLRIDSFFRMEEREKQMIRSQRLRRAVTCMKRKEREGGEEDSEEEEHSPVKLKRGKSANRNPKTGGEKEEERSVAGGGFLGSQVTFETPITSLKNMNSTSHESPSVKGDLQPSKSLPQSVRSCSSSSGADSDDGGEAAMVTARSVFEGSRRGQRGKSTRGRGRGRGRGKK